MTDVYTKVYTGTPLFNNKKILYAIVDQAEVRNKNIELFNKVKDITIAITSRLSTSVPGDVRYFNNIDDAMNNSEAYDIVIVQSVGNFIRHNVFFEYLNDYYNNNPDFFIIAFTLDWESEHGKGWIECHHQMIVVNRKTWTSIGSPKFGGWETVTEELPNYDRSIENFHDKYTPLWIKGADGSTNKTRTNQGWGFIKAALQAGIQIDNFSQEMRNCRLYVYPESDSDQLYEAFVTKNSKLVSNSNQKKWINSLITKPGIWIYNSEQYEFGFDLGSCDTYLGPAAGFKYLDALNYNPNIKFIFYDFSQESLDWIQELRTYWNGEDLLKYLKSKPAEFQKLYKFINGTIENNQNILLQEFGGEEKFKQLWNQFQQAPVQFIHCNITNKDELNSLLSKFSGRKMFFYHSNIFATDAIINHFSIDELSNMHEQFLDTIFNLFPSIVYGTDPLGEWEIYDYGIKK